MIFYHVSSFQFSFYFRSFSSGFPASSLQSYVTQSFAILATGPFQSTPLCKMAVTGDGGSREIKGGEGGEKYERGERQTARETERQTERETERCGELLIHPRHVFLSLPDYSGITLTSIHRLLTGTPCLL